MNTSVGYVLIRKSYQQDPCTSCKCRKQGQSEPAQLVCKTLNCKRLNKDCHAVAPPEEGECCGKCVQPPSPPMRPCNVTLANGTIVGFEEGNFSLGQCDACTCESNGTYSCEFVEAVLCPEDEACLEFKKREIGSCCRKCLRYSKQLLMNKCICIPVCLLKLKCRCCVLGLIMDGWMVW